MVNKRNLLSPIFIISLSIIFILVSFCVFLSRGKSRFWISKKMWIGSLLLSFTALSNQSCEFFGTSCYDPPPPPNNISIDNYYYSGDAINLNETNVLNGVIYDREGVDFSFNITDSLMTDTLQVGELIPTDGEFDNYTEDFYIKLDTSLTTNTYLLNFYDKKISEQVYPLHSHYIKIKNED